MGERLQEGEKIPFFRYDTPYSAGNRLRDLLHEKAPLVLVFMSNFGHPVTRVFAGRYAATRSALTGANFALVVRSRADKLASSIGPDSLPYPLLCDADGVLYEHFAILQRRGTLMTYSLEGWRILSAAKKQGYRPPKDVPEQLPLTLILDEDGTVLFCHYGTSLTDVPADCASMQSILEELELDHPVPEALVAAAVAAHEGAAGEAGENAPAPAAMAKRGKAAPRAKRAEAAEDAEAENAAPAEKPQRAARPTLAEPDRAAAALYALGEEDEADAPTKATPKKKPPRRAPRKKQRSAAARMGLGAPPADGPEDEVGDNFLAAARNALGRVTAPDPDFAPPPEEIDATLGTLPDLSQTAVKGLFGDEEE